MLSRTLFLFFSLILLGVSQAQPPAAAGDGRNFGIGQPAGLNDLPSGRTKDKILSLPPAAQRQALAWLQRFSFPEADLAHIHVDDQGGVFYRDPTPQTAPVGLHDTAKTTAPELAAISATEAFSLHSKPGSANVVYLDFDGHVITGTAWNSSYSVLQARPFDRDGDPTGFSQSELAEIAEIWHRVAEDFAPFDIDVTTEEPVNFTPTTGRLLITRDDDADGNPMPAQGAGGVAYVGVWGYSSYPGYYSPALVYYDNLGGGYPPYVAEAASHELGHNLNLSHDGQSPGDGSYYTGHGSGYVSWGPVMGVGYYANVTQWSKGEYSNATNLQDDLNVLAGYLAYRDDDHGDTPTQATPLLIDSAGVVTAGNPETDPLNLYPDNKGVIERSTDSDYFWLEAGDGLLELTVTPAWEAYYNDSRRGANLDIQAALYDAAGLLVTADDPADDTDAYLSATVSAGNYYLAITGVGTGNPDSGYSDYASLGQYFINGSVPVAEPNRAPNAVADSAVVDEDGTVDIAVLANDTDPDGDSLTVSAVGNAGNGAVSSDGSVVSYVPAADFYGSDSFSYSVSDGRGGSASAMVNVTVNPVNDPPNAVFSYSCTDLDCGFDASGSSDDGTIVAFSWDFGDGGSAGGVAPGHRYATPGSYSVTLTVTDDAGATGTSSASVTVTASPVRDLASADVNTAGGTVSGSYVSTQTQNDGYQTLGESHSGGKPSQRYDTLEHVWQFNLTGGSRVFHIDAYRSAANGDLDGGFDFAWSDSPTGPWTPLLTVSATTDGDAYLSADIGSGNAATVYVRVTDSDSTQGSLAYSTLYVDHMYFDAGTPPSEPPAAAADPTPVDGATGVSTGVTLDWSAGAGSTSRDVYFGTSPTPPLASAGQTAAGYAPGPLSAYTTYYWRVDERNALGTTAGPVWRFTTGADSGPTQALVDSVTTATVNAGKGSKTGRAVVTVRDEQGNPVAGATVTGTFSGSYNETASAASAADGSAVIGTAATVKGGVSFTFCVTGISHPSLIYNVPNPADCGSL